MPNKVKTPKRPKKPKSPTSKEKREAAREYLKQILKDAKKRDFKEFASTYKDRPY